MSAIDSVLKNIALTAFAAQTLDGETWNGMAVWCNEQVQQGKAYREIQHALREVEAEMKKMYETTVMPAAWRSAKSVALQAIAHNIPFVEKGKAHGKSAVEEAIRNSKLTARAMHAGISPVYAELQALEKARVLLERQQARDGSKYNSLLMAEVHNMMSFLPTIGT